MSRPVAVIFGFFVFCVIDAVAVMWLLSLGKQAWTEHGTLLRTLVYVVGMLPFLAPVVIWFMNKPSQRKTGD
jgi:hypothetical protein